MGVRLTTTEGVTALYDSVTGFAFGPTFDDADRAEAFAAYAPIWAGAQGSEAFAASDLRTWTEEQLRACLAAFDEAVPAT